MPYGTKSKAQDIDSGIHISVSLIATVGALMGSDRECLVDGFATVGTGLASVVGRHGHRDLSHTSRQNTPTSDETLTILHH